MRVLYASPVFSDYRIPFYKKLNELFQDNFFVVYSPLRFRMDKLDETLNKIPSVLGNIAHTYEDEKVIKIKKPFNKDFDAYYRIPLLRNFTKNIKKYNPDVLITEGFFQWTPLVVWYARIHRLPVYISYERTAHTERFAPKFKIWHRKLTDKFVTGYFVNGTETKHYLESLGIKKDKIHITGMNADSESLRNGVASVSNEEKEDFRKSLNVVNDGIVYLFSGQFIPRKGIIYLLTAWTEHIKKYPFDHLVLIGNGELYDEYKSKFSNENSIHLEGRVPYDNVYKYYAISDVFVIPTLEDNWCLVVPEAMACGMPIACSKYNGGAIDLMREGENGTVFDPLNPKSMFEALGFFHGKDLKAMGLRSKELEKPFNTDTCANRVYDSIITDWRNSHIENEKH